MAPLFNINPNQLKVINELRVNHRLIITMATRWMDIGYFVGIERAELLKVDDVRGESDELLYLKPISLTVCGGNDLEGPLHLRIS